MEEAKHFQSEMKYDLPTYREFQKLNVQAHLRNTIMYLIVTLCLLFLIFMLRYAANPVTLLLLSLLWLGVHLHQWHRIRSGGVEYKRMLRSNNGLPPEIRVIVDDSCIKTLNLNSSQEVTTPFTALRFLMESKNLLVLVDDLKMCHPVDKRNLEGGSAEELTAYLKQNCPKLKKRIRKGLLGRIAAYLCVAISVLALLVSLAHLLKIPEKLSGQLHNGMTYQQMAQELENLDIHISRQTIQEMVAYDAEYAMEYGDYYKHNPQASKVLDMLYWEGAGIYDSETGLWTPSSSGIYWFDMEVFDVSRMYTDFLMGVDAMDEALTFSGITEDYSSVNWETGTGIATVSFDYCGKTYHINASFDQDWFDPLVLTHVARILDQDTAPEKLWFTYDGQALFLYYGTPEQAEILAKKTGTIWLDPVKNPVYGG